MHAIKEWFHHTFIPRESNNHRAKLLHHSSISLLIIALLVGQMLIGFSESKFPSVLGISHSISIDELVSQTNQKRQEAGLSPLSFNNELSAAAAQKAQHMFAQNYWAHNAPDGTTPWIFIKGSGYEYVFAGENLARGYSNTTDAINAWMASPGHRDNIMSGNYKDIGFAILTGTLNGEETVLIVEMFGSRTNANVAAEKSVEVSPTAVPTPVATSAPIAVNISPTQVILPTAMPQPTSIPTLIPTSVPTQGDTATNVASVKSEPLINSKSMQKNVSLIIVVLLLIVLAVDLILVERRKIARVVAHNLDHIIFLSIIAITILIFSKGVIL